MNNIYQNQTAETSQLANNTQTNINLAIPKVNNPTMLPNINNNPQNAQNFNPTFNPIISPQINPVFNPHFENKPTINVNMPKMEVKTTKTFIGVTKFGSNPERMSCPNCHENIITRTEKSTNMKALLTAIGTCYCGFALFQICNGKDTSINDCVHYCPICGLKIGVYYAL